MARGALQIIRHRPVILVAVRLAHHVGHHRGDPAQLGMSEGIRGTGVGEEPAARIRGSLGDHDHAVTVLADALSHAIEKFLLLERHFRKEDDVGRFACAAAGEPGGRGDPAGVTTHHFEHEHPGGGARHGGDIERRLARGHRDVLGDRAEARTTIRSGQIVVHGLRYAHTGDGIAERRAELRHLERGVHRVIAAVVEEVADVVGAEHLDQALILGAVLLDALQLEARRAERAGRRVLERADGRGALAADVDEILGERTDDAVTPGVHLGDVSGAHRRLDHAARGGVDDGRDAA